MYLVLFLLITYIASITFIGHRGRTFDKLSRRLSDFSSFMVPFNIPAYLLSKIPTTPLIDKEHFPEINILEENWEVIREEALKLYELGYIATGDELPASSFYRDNRWKSFYLKLYDNQIPSAYEHAPKTMALIDQVPSMNLALFAILNPHKKINKHHDPFAYTVRYSLGLSTPNSDDCGIVVNRTDYKWKDGDSIIFDETYMHHAYNNTDVPRLIMMTDLDRPLKIQWIQKTYYYFGWLFNRFFASDNLDSEYTGLGNKLGKGVIAYKAFLQSIKKNNKTAYTIGKNSIILTVLVIIITSIW